MTDAPIDPFALVGQLLDGQYRVDRVVGEGGFGVVYKGWHLSFEQPIAVKALKVPYAVDAKTQSSVLAKFREEAKLCYVLSQASLNIVRSIGFGALDTPAGIWAPYLVLEWLEGRPLSVDLAERAERGLCGRSLMETVEVLEPVARGLAYAHSQRVAHRDVKPANIFMTKLAGDESRTTAKLLDFGIAKVMAEGATAASPRGAPTAFSSFTPYYAAPEQFDPRFGPTGPWTDVYGFALVLTEMLTDRSPVEGDDVVAVVARATDPRRRPTPRVVGAIIPDVVEAVFARALAVDPKARYADAAAFWDALTTSARINRPPESPVASVKPRTQQHTAPMPSAAGRASSDTMPMQSVERGSTQKLPAAPSIRTPAVSRPLQPPGAVPTPAPMSAPWAPPVPPVRPSTSSASYNAAGQPSAWQAVAPPQAGVSPGMPQQAGLRPGSREAPRAAPGAALQRSGGTTIVAIVVGVLLVALWVGLTMLRR